MPESSTPPDEARGEAPASLPLQREVALIARALRQRALRGLAGAVVTGAVAAGVIVVGLIVRRDESLKSDPTWLVVALGGGLLWLAFWFGSRARLSDARAPERSPLVVSLEGDGSAVEAVGERVGQVSEVWVRMKDGEEIGLPVAPDEVAPLVAFIRERSPKAGTFAPPGGRRPARRRAP